MATVAQAISKDFKATTLTEEREAALQEKSLKKTKPISASLLKKVQRVHELKKIMAPLLAEIEQIKVDAFKEMDNKGVDILTRKGVPVVSRDDSTSTSTDTKGLLHDYPEIAGLYIKKVPIKKINWKNEFE